MYYFSTSTYYVIIFTDSVSDVYGQSYIYIYIYIKVYPGWRDNILGGHDIRHFKRTIVYVHVSYWPPLWSGGQSPWLQGGDVLCFLWGTNWIYICYEEGSRPPLWSMVRVPGYTTEMYCVSCEVRTTYNERHIIQNKHNSKKVKLSP
jgi:hypothetical protein